MKKVFFALIVTLSFASCNKCLQCTQYHDKGATKDLPITYCNQKDAELLETTYSNYDSYWICN